MTKIPGHWAGPTIATRIAAPPAAAGRMMTATKAEAGAGFATLKVIRKRLAGAGKTDIDLSAATRRMNAEVRVPARMRESESRSRSRDDGHWGARRASFDDATPLVGPLPASPFCWTFIFFFFFFRMRTLQPPYTRCRQVNSAGMSRVPACQLPFANQTAGRDRP